MNKYLVKGINKENEEFKMEVFAESVEHASMVSIGDLISDVTSVKRINKYNVGDKVIYLDLQKNKYVGVIKDVQEMDEHEWNKDKEDRCLYLLNNYDYLRNESEIVGLYNN